MTARMRTSGTTVEAGAPMALFPTRIFGGGSVGTNKPNYAVARDGRFLINESLLEESAAAPHPPPQLGPQTEELNFVVHTGIGLVYAALSGLRQTPCRKNDLPFWYLTASAT